MIRIMICCGGGFSSSAMAVKVKKEIKEKGLEDKVFMDFCPFTLSKDHVDEYDIMMCCPHLKYQIPDYNAKYIKNRIPIYIFPPKMYGTMIAEELYQDAVDILEAFKKNPQNPFYFPGEENILKVHRICAYRNQKK